MEETIEHSRYLKLLYVEDNEDAREATVLILEEFFDNIIIAVDGEDGFKKFQENEIDLILTDLNMPKLNGLDMLRKIKEIDADVPSLILSAYNESEYIQEGAKVGANDYVLKPLNIDKFIVVLQKIINEKII